MCKCVHVRGCTLDGCSEQEKTFIGPLRGVAIAHHCRENRGQKHGAHAWQLLNVDT